MKGFACIFYSRDIVVGMSVALDIFMAFMSFCLAIALLFVGAIFGSLFFVLISIGILVCSYLGRGLRNQRALDDLTRSSKLRHKW